MFSTRAILLGFLTITSALYYHVLESVVTDLGRDHEVPVHAASSPYHKLLLDESVHDRIKNTNSSDYTWVGNHWTPPPGVPTFTPRQLKEYYSQRNVLVIGDSTSRRFYGTLYTMMNATNWDDMKAGEIEQDKYKNKFSCYAEMGDRFLSYFAGAKWTVCNNFTVEVEDTDGSGKTEKHFKFDHATQYCYEDIEWLWRDKDVNKDFTLEDNHMAGFSRDYDLVILATGIWELAKPNQCMQKRPDETSPERLQLMLEAVERNTPDGLQMVFRNSAFDTRFTGEDDIIRDSNAVSRQFFHDLDHKSDLELGRYERNMTLVDWGGVMQNRSYGEDRIEGDHPAHYGLEARLLFIQQLTHELVKSELIAIDI